MTELVAAFAVLIVPALLVLGWLAVMGLAVATIADSSDPVETDPLEPTDRRARLTITRRPDPTLAFPAGAPVH